MADVRDPEPAFLINAARRAAERSSVRAIATEAGLSHGGLHKLIVGNTHVIHGVTIRKLRAWYLREWAAYGDGLTSEAAAYLVRQLVASIQEDGERHSAALELVNVLERIYATSGTPRPAWLAPLSNEYRKL